MKVDGFRWEFHPESVAVLEYLKAHVTPGSREEYPMHVIRAGHLKRSTDLSQRDKVYDVTRSEMHVPSPHVKEGIPFYIYTPKKLTSDPKMFVYFHGGGLVLGTRQNYDTMCNIVAQNAGCIVINVEYRLAPEHMIPAAFDDGCTVMKWVKENKQKLGGTENSKVGMGGDSAGGTITASVTHDVPVDFQVLIYPQVFPARDYSANSMQKYKQGPLLDMEYIKWFEDKSVPHGEESNPRLASILRPRFDHLPPALVIIAEIDMLYDSSWAYAKKLKESGVPVEVHEYKGAIHAFYGFAKCCPKLCDDAYEKVVQFITNQ